MKDLATIRVEELSRYAGTAELNRFIGTLKNYNLFTLEDLQSISMDQFCKFKGVGVTKVEKLQSLKTLLVDNLPRIQAGSDCAENENSAFSEETIAELSTVPIEYLLSFLTDTDEKTISALTSVITYVNIKSVGELCMLQEDALMNTPHLGKKKVQRVLSLLEFLRDGDNKDALIKGYEDSSVVRSLPSTCSGTLAEDILKFINEFVALSAQQNVQDSTAKCVELILLHGYSPKDAAKNCKIDYERVRQIVYSDTHPSFFAKVREMVNGTCKKYDKPKFVLSEEFKTKLEALKNVCRSGMRKQDLEQKIGLNRVCNKEHKVGAMEFANKLLGFTVFDGKRHGVRVAGEYLISCDINDVKKDVWGLVFRTLDSFVKPYIKETLVSRIQGTFPNMKKDAINTVVGIIESDYNFFKVLRDGAAIKYQLQWNALLSEQTRIERILYEAQRSMTKWEIEEELKRRLDENGLKHPSTITPSQSDNIFELIEGGTWIWREYAENETIVSLKEEVTKFVARNKAVKLDDVYNHIAQITQKYNERTIRSYVTELCFETDEGFYVYKSCRKAYANIYHFCPQRSQLLEEVVAMLDQNRYYTTSEIEELYEQQYSLIGGRRLIYNICHMHTDFFDTINHGGRNQSQWKLRIPKKEILNRLRRERDDRSNLVLHRTEHLKECRMEAVNTLVYAENNCMPMVDLVKSLLEFMPRGTRKEGIYKIFDEKIFIKDASQGKKKTVVSLNRDVYLKEFKESLVAANKDNDKREAIASNTQSNSADIGIGYSLSFPKDYDAIKEAVLVELSVEFAKIEKDNMGIDFGKAWDRMLQIMNVEHEGSDGVFRRLFTRLYRYLLGHTNPIERFDLYRDLNLDYEAYLRSLLNITTTGLVDVIKSSQQRNLLPCKDDGCSITRYTSWLINHRNDLSHQGGKTKSLAELSRDINQTLVLYLYVAHRVNTIM